MARRVREREREREEDKARGRSRLQPKRIGARGLNDPSLLGRHPGSPPPVSRFTAIRFLPPLRALVLSYCLRCCFLRGANVLLLPRPFCFYSLLFFLPSLVSLRFSISARFSPVLSSFPLRSVSPPTILVLSPGPSFRSESETVCLTHRAVTLSSSILERVYLLGCEEKRRIQV